MPSTAQYLAQIRTAIEHLRIAARQDRDVGTATMHQAVERLRQALN